MMLAGTFKKDSLFRFQTILLCLFAGAIYFSISIMEASLALALLLTFFLQPDEVKNQIKHNVLLWALFVYFISSILTIPFAIDRFLVLKEMKSDLTKFLIFFALIISTNDKNRPQIFTWYLVGATLIALLGITQFFSAAQIGEARAHGTMNPITYAEALSLAAVLALSLFLNESRQRFLVVRFFQFVIVVCGVLLSGSRGPTAGLTVSLLVVLLLSKGATKRRLMVLTLMLAMGLIFFTRGSKRVSSNVAQLKWILSTSEKCKDIKLGADFDRRDLWETAARIWHDNQLVGVGAGNIKKIFDFYHPSPVVFSFGPKIQFGYGNVHNLYLQLLSERGIVGMFAWCLFFSLCCLLALQNFINTGNGEALWALAILPGFCVMNLSETSFSHSVVASGFWLAMSLLPCKKANLKWTIMGGVLLAVFFNALIVSAAISLTEIKRRQVFSGPYFLWDGPRSISSDEVQKIAPPLRIINSNGAYKLSPTSDGEGLKILYLGQDKVAGPQLLIGYTDRINYFPILPSRRGEVIFEGMVKAKSSYKGLVSAVILDIGQVKTKVNKVAIPIKDGGNFYSLKAPLQQDNYLTVYYLETMLSEPGEELEWSQVKIESVSPRLQRS